MSHIYQSANIGPQVGEPLCDGTEQVVEAGNNGSKTDVVEWEASQARLRPRSDAAFLRAYPTRK